MIARATCSRLFLNFLLFSSLSTLPACRSAESEPTARNVKPEKAFEASSSSSLQTTALPKGSLKKNDKPLASSRKLTARSLEVSPARTASAPSASEAVSPPTVVPTPGSDSLVLPSTEPSAPREKVPEEVQAPIKTPQASATEEVKAKNDSKEASPVTEELAPPAVVSKANREEAALDGEMRIEFGTRKELDSNGQPRLGAEDVYKVNLTLASGEKVSGTIARRARIVGGLLGRELQGSELRYSLSLPGTKFSGNVPFSTDGILNFDSGNLLISSEQGNSLKVSGRIQGKKSQDSSSFSEKLVEYTRIFNKKKVTLQVKHVDPLSFQRLIIPAGSGPLFPELQVNGRLDYDYDTGNWLSTDLKMEYVDKGIRQKDVISGSIHWVEDPSRDYNGKGYYEFNLRFNEKSSDESSFFAESNDESQFFETADDVAALLGRVEYRDSFGDLNAGSPQRPVVASLVSYHLKSNLLSPVQVANFVRLWLLIVGPVNDE